MNDEPREPAEPVEATTNEPEVEGHLDTGQDAEDDGPEVEGHISDRRAKDAIEPLTGALRALRGL